MPPGRDNRAAAAAPAEVIPAAPAAADPGVPAAAVAVQAGAAGPAAAARAEDRRIPGHPTNLGPRTRLRRLRGQATPAAPGKGRQRRQTPRGAAGGAAVAAAVAAAGPQAATLHNRCKISLPLPAP